jgi:hypothetical protein
VLDHRVELHAFDLHGFDLQWADVHGSIFTVIAETCAV